MKLKFIILLTIMLFLSGCINKNILDNIRIVTAIGFDTADGDNYEITAVVPRFNPDKSTSSEAYTTLADISRDAHLQLNMSDSKPFVSGKIEVILASQDLAKNGIINLSDGFLRDPSVGSRVFFAISEMPAKTILQGQYSSQDNGMFISDMLTQNMEAGPLPKTNLHLFFNHFYDKGRDPYLPLITIKDNRISISGLALLKDDKMIEKLGRSYLFAFKTLNHRKTRGDQVQITLDNGETAVLYKIDSKRTINISKINDLPNLNYEVDINLTVREYSGVELLPPVVEEIRKKVEDRFKKDTEDMVRQFQELEIDPLGIGSQVRSQTRNWDSEKWHDQYPNIEVTITPNVTISETGIAE
ncbi:Ger(x)C family spore germination protein [Piscibacillus sp. B03]